jgi:hypothetical protein
MILVRRGQVARPSQILPVANIFKWKKNMGFIATFCKVLRAKYTFSLTDIPHY